jgi:hypothetical protein
LASRRGTTVFTMKIAQQLRDIATRIRLEGATAGQPLGCAS